MQYALLPGYLLALVVAQAVHPAVVEAEDIMEAEPEYVLVQEPEEVVILYREHFLLYILPGFKPETVQYPFLIIIFHLVQEPPLREQRYLHLQQVALHTPALSIWLVQLSNVV